MDSKFIEKLDKARYNAWLIQTIGFALFAGILIFHFATGHESIGLVIAEVTSILIFLAGVLWKKSIFLKIMRDNKIRQALNNELYLQYGYKTYFWGFWAFLVALLTLIYFDLSTLMTCMIALYAGSLTQQIATLVYYGGNNKSKE